MSEICLILHIRDFTGQRFQEIKDVFKDTAFPCDIYGYEVIFNTMIECVKREPQYSKDDGFDITVSFTGQIPAEINVENNDIYFYDGPKDIPTSMISVRELKQYFKHDCLDGDFQTQLEILCLSIVQAVILTAPFIDINTAHFTILLNQIKFKEKRHIEIPVHEEAYDKWGKIFKTNLEIKQTWDWLRKNGIQFSSKPNCPAISLLYYLFNRQYHEMILYSVIGLEALYVEKNKRYGKSYTLQNRIHSVFPDVSKEEIKRLYEIRSTISHGEGDISSAIVWLDLINNNDEYEEIAILASAILIESIRKLVFNDATSFVFTETLDITYEYV